jgi:predicted nucleic acid-binding protein
MDRHLLDTSALSDVLQPPAKRSPNVAQHVKQYLRAHGHFTFSEISCYEVLRGLRKKRASTQEQRFIDFCGNSELLPVDFRALDRAATLWAEGRQRGLVVDDGDLVIAATALLHGLPLVTANTPHFHWITDLNLVNWRDV